MIGKTVSHYKILEKLGAGGMGVVYRARDTRLDREVAIKLLPPHLSSDKEARQRFIQEAKSASAIDHNHICTIYEIDQTDEGSTFIVMAYYQGETLRELIDRGAITPTEAIDIASQVASGMGRAHDRNIVHRDLKPQNIIITDEGEAKIIDFGLAKLTGRTRLTREGSTLGTAAYMSPEQARGEDVDHRSDIFSLGAILYEMLSGVSPFRGEHEAALLYEIVNEEPEPLPEQLINEFPGLKIIAEKLLAKDPADRFQDAGELRGELLRLTGGTSHSHSSSGSSRSGSGQSSKKVYRFIGLALVAAIIIFAGYYLLTRDRGGAGPRSIAVLPFENIVTEPEYEWFGDGMREAILGHLTKIEDLKVISNASSNRFRDLEMPPEDIAAELGVSTLLMASVQQSGGRLLLMIKLIDAATDDIIWTENYNREMKDVFAVQTDVALNVVEKLKATLSSEVEQRIEARPTVNIEAYKLLMKGQEQWSRGTHQDRIQAIETYKEAIRLDPEYAEARARLANAYVLIMFYGHQRPHEVIPRAREAAREALDIDSHNTLALSALAMVKIYSDWDLDAGEKAYIRAGELNPGSRSGYTGSGWVLMFQKRCDEAIENYKKGLELDPLVVGLRQNLGELLFYCRRYEESINASLEAIEMNPNFPQSHMFLGMAYNALGMKNEAVAALDKEHEMSGGQTPEVENWIGTSYAMVGEYDKAREVLAHLKEISEDQWVSPVMIASIHFGLDESEEGFRWLEKAIEERDPRFLYVRIHPVYDSWRKDPRYVDLMRRAGLED